MGSIYLGALASPFPLLLYTLALSSEKGIGQEIKETVH